MRTRFSVTGLIAAALVVFIGACAGSNPGAPSNPPPAPIMENKIETRSVSPLKLEGRTLPYGVYSATDVVVHYEITSEAWSAAKNAKKEITIKSCVSNSENTVISSGCMGEVARGPRGTVTTHPTILVDNSLRSRMITTTHVINLIVEGDLFESGTTGPFEAPLSTATGRILDKDPVLQPWTFQN
jgi:hypothetical protein